MADSIEAASAASGSAPGGAPRIPAVYLLWHPGCAWGQALAQSVFDWLRPGLGIGPDVFFRSLPAPGAASGLPAPLPMDPRDSRADPRNNLQLVLPLIDAHMVADEAWRWWLDGIARLDRQCSVLLPVALDGTAYNMGGAVRALNAIRPVGLPPTAAGLEPAIRSLRKQVTEALTRLVLPRRAPGRRERAAEPDDAPPRIGLFLSHAKRDGTGPARALRDHIHGQTQLAAFYDDNDIAYGASFARILEDGVASPDTAALIAVRTAAYATRPWCRRELFQFRTPRLAAREGNTERWRLNPTLIVEAMEGAEYTPGMAEAGNTPLIRWRADDPDIAETVVTTVLRDAMLRAFNDALGASLPPPPPPPVQRIVINWLPDAVTLLRIPALRAPPGQVEVVYPGRGLPGQDLQMLAEFFPGIPFRAFEAVRAAPPAPPSAVGHRDDPARLLVGLSVSADPQDLLARGLSDAHLRELLVRLGRPILRHGASLAYGGRWRDGDAEASPREENDFTFDLLRLVRAEQEEVRHDRDGDADADDAGPEPGKLYSYAPWPYTLAITPPIEAQWVNACRIIRVSQEEAGLQGAAVIAGTDFDRDSRRAALNEAVALSAMRRMQMEGSRVPVPGLPRPVRVPKLTERVLLGGRLLDYRGLVPGLFEEFLLAAERDCPVYLLGGFGGAAGALARAILEPGGDRPPELTLGWHEARNPRLLTLGKAALEYGLPDGCRGAGELLDAVFRQVLRARRDPGAVLNLCLPREALREMLTTTDIPDAARLVRGAFERAHGLPPLAV